MKNKGMVVGTRERLRAASHAGLIHRCPFPFCGTGGEELVGGEDFENALFLFRGGQVGPAKHRMRIAFESPHADGAFSQAIQTTARDSDNALSAAVEDIAGMHRNAADLDRPIYLP